MTDEQRQTFETFKKDVLAAEQQQKWTAIVPDEFTILRFLQADKYDTSKAMARLEANQIWLQEINIPKLLTTNPPQHLQQYRKLRARAFMGRSHDGMPIFVERLGDFFNAIPSKEGNLLTRQDWMDCFLYDLAELIAQIKESYRINLQNNQPITWKATWIMDTNNVGFYRAGKAISTIQLLDKLTEPNFPELAGPVVIMRVPTIVNGIYKICKAFLDPVVAAKISVYGGLPKNELLQRMDESVLFEEFGGTNTKEFPKAEYS